VPGYHYDPVKARKLLSEAGFPQGRGLPAIKLLTIPVYADLAAYIANELNIAGISVQVEAIQKSLLLEQTARSQALFFRGSWIADYPDAENYLSVFYGKNPAPRIIPGTAIRDSMRFMKRRSRKKMTKPGGAFTSRWTGWSWKMRRLFLYGMTWSFTWCIPTF
jgi:ABC-type transport system substrate-binding protein